MRTKAILQFERERRQGLDRHKLYAEYDLLRARELAEEAERRKSPVADLTETWQPPSRSTALQKYPSRSTHSARGNIVYKKVNKSVGYSSGLERRAALVLMANRGVIDVEEQAARIPWVDAEGVQHEHLLDFRATMHDKRRIAVTVKEFEMVERRDLSDEVERLRPNLDDHADDIIILTERELTEGAAANAQTVLYGLDHRIDEHCSFLRKVLRGCYGRVSAVDLAKLLPNYADGWVAVLCLVYDKVLRIVDIDRRLEEAPYVVVDHAVLAGAQSPDAA